MWALAVNYLLCFKQPVLLPKFTQHGYHKVNIPDDVYARLKEFYDTSRARDGVTSENGDGLSAVINSDWVRTGMVQLSDDVRAAVSRALLERMQAWCGCTLQETAFYGIREYYRGNVLRMHVDRVETHVISAILQVDQDLRGDDDTPADDWALVVIDFSGRRHNVTLRPGEMLLYESATLIHGRPRAFKGRRFANCFLHYKPTSDWHWERKIVESRSVITDNDAVYEAADVINTPLTLRQNDEDAQLKTEL